jgi:D-glycero-D-manno-heptose 1,7-bisphosphate phosphatase
MILDSARGLAVDALRSVMIGDRWSDIEAGRRAGCRTVLIGDGYGEANPWHVVPDAQVPTLTAAAAWILARRESMQ